MGLFDKFKKKEEKQETVITPQVNNEMPAESNNLGQSAITQIEQSNSVPVEEVPTLPENQFVDNTPQVVEQPVVENTNPQQDVPSFDNIFNATPADLIPTSEETYTEEKINETVLATGAQIEESKPIVEQQIALDVNIEDVVEGGTTKEDEITRIVSETVANRDKKEKQNDAITPDIADVTSKVDPTPVVEVPAPVVEVQAPVVEVQTPVVEVQAPIVEEAAPVVEMPTPVVEVQTPVVEAPAPVVEMPTPVVEDAAPVVEMPTPVVEVQTPVVEEPAPVVEEPTPVAEVQAPVVEAPAPVVEVPTPVVEVQAPVVEAQAPVVEVQTPVVEMPTPVVEAQAPVVEAPAPVVEVQTPVAEMPTPVVEEPTSVVEMPTPVAEEPAPVVEMPTPVVEVQTPVAEVQAPVVEVPTASQPVEKPTIVLPAVEEEAEIELPSNPFEENIETPQTIEMSVPVVEVQAPVVEAPTPVVEVQAPVIEEQTPVVEEATPTVEVTAPVVEEPTQVEEVPIATVEVQTTELTPEINVETKQEITANSPIVEVNDMSNEVQSFEASTTIEENVEEEQIQPQIDEQEENYEPVIVQEEPVQLAPANINDPIIEKKVVDNSPILPQEQTTISEEQLVERKEEPRSYIEEKKKITRFCDECGTMVTDDGVVCPECGMPIK